MLICNYKQNTWEQLGMNTNDQARELMAKKRQHDEHINEAMLNRSVEEVENQEMGNTAELARELLAEERLHNEQMQENMLNRATPN